MLHTTPHCQHSHRTAATVSTLPPLQPPGIKSGADARLGVMQEELGKVVAAREKAEAAKRRSEEMLTKELVLKKEGEAESAQFEKLVTLEETKVSTPLVVKSVSQSVTWPEPSPEPRPLP